MRKLVLFSVLALGLMTWSACTYDSVGVTTVTTTHHVACGDTTHLPTTKIVLVKNYEFSPDTITINTGDTVRFVWVDGTHTTTSATVPNGAPTWDKPMSATDCIYEQKFTIPGTYSYVCTPHAVVMFGTIIVQ